MSIADWEIEQPAGDPAHDEDKAPFECRCADCVAFRVDYFADMEIH